MGGGIETLFTRAWSAKIEYLHYDLGSSRVEGTFDNDFFNVENKGDIVRAGLNYRFYEDRAPLK